jgi:hypothetical protein
MVRGGSSVTTAAIAAVSIVISPAVSLAGPAIGQFEVKNLEADPGKLEFQSQNAHSWGLPRRQISRNTDDELLYDDNTVIPQRHALEMEGTLTDFLRLRLGIEYEREWIEEPENVASANEFSDLKLEEVAIEVVAIFKRVPESGGIGFGALTEFEHPVTGDELNTIVFGPIIEAKQGPWDATVNLTFVHFFGNGPRGDQEVERDAKWDFSYAAQLAYTVSPDWIFALEGYGTFDRLGNSGTPGEQRDAFGDQDQHRAGPVIYYSFSPDRTGLSETRQIEHAMSDEEGEEGTVVSLGVGLLFGLNEYTPDQTLKWSVEVEF